MSTRVTIQPGMLLGARYRVLEELGRGGMARVHRAEDERLGRTVAVKVLAPELGHAETFVERFHREARAVARLAHPNIVPLFDFGVQDGQPFMVLQLVEGPSLRRVLRERGALAPEEAARISSELAAALAHAHRRGIVHGDVKPLNVLLDRRSDTLGHALLTDFGVAQAISETARQASAKRELYGSLPYLAPEQLSGAAGGASPRADLYALGIVLYEMLTGTHPFQGHSAAESATLRLEQEPAAPSRLNPVVPPGLDRLVARVLARDPERRYPDAETLRRALTSGGETAPAVV